MTRITKEDLKQAEITFNNRFERISIKVCYRYNYVALDLYKNGVCHQTMKTGLTKNQAYGFLNTLLKGIWLKEIDGVV